MDKKNYVNVVNRDLNELCFMTANDNDCIAILIKIEAGEWVIKNLLFNTVIGYISKHLCFYYLNSKEPKRTRMNYKDDRGGLSRVKLTIELYKFVEGIV